MVGFVAYVFSEPILHCNYNTSVDISQGTRLSNGDIIFGGEMYKQHEYFLTRKPRRKEVVFVEIKSVLESVAHSDKGTQISSGVLMWKVLRSPRAGWIWRAEGIEMSSLRLFIDKIGCQFADRLYVSQISKNLHYLTVRNAICKITYYIQHSVPNDWNKYSWTGWKLFHLELNEIYANLSETWTFSHKYGNILAFRLLQTIISGTKVV